MLFCTFFNNASFSFFGSAKSMFTFLCVPAHSLAGALGGGCAPREVHSCSLERGWRKKTR
jgi:hypothetical protein